MQYGAAVFLAVCGKKPCHLHHTAYFVLPDFRLFADDFRLYFKPGEIRFACFKLPRFVL